MFSCARGRADEQDETEDSSAFFVIFHWPSGREAKAQLSPAVCRMLFPQNAPARWRRMPLHGLIG